MANQAKDPPTPKNAQTFLEKANFISEFFEPYRNTLKTRVRKEGVRPCEAETQISNGQLHVKVGSDRRESLPKRFYSCCYDI